MSHPPSEREAVQLITCSESHDDFEHSTVYRIYNAHLQVGKPRAYAVGDAGGKDIDPSASVYPIRGKKIVAICIPVADYMKNAEKNCMELDTEGDGLCYQTPIGGWKYTLDGIFMMSRYDMPPPN